MTSDEEKELAGFLIDVSKMGHGKTKQEVLLIVQKAVEKKGKMTDHFNGEGWWTGFTQRHPELALRTADPLSYSRSNAVTQETLDHYFTLLQKTLTENNLFDRPSMIYNMDESGMPLDHKQLKRIAERGAKKVHGHASGNKAQITILACANAAGTTLPPMVIFKGERFNHDWTKGEVPNMLYGMSPQGWIDQELFALWLQKSFVKSIPPARPVLLLLDGHSSHYTPEAIKLAAEETVIIFCLPPHMTHVVQPLDVSFFGPLKKYWSKVCHMYMAENPGKVVTKFQFSSLFSKAWYLTIRPDIIMSGFRKVGVCPFDFSAVKPYSPSSEKSSTSKVQNDLNSEQNPNTKSKESPEEQCQTRIQFAPGQVLLYEHRYESGYDLYDPDYFEWLQQTHPESLPDHTPSSASTTPTDPLDQTVQSNSSEKAASDVSLSTLNPLEDPSHSTPSSSVSKGLSETRKVLSALSEFLYHPERDSSSKKATTSTARVLTSVESLTMLVEKGKKKQEAEEAKEKPKKEREDKKKEREAEKECKVEERKRKKEEQEKKPS